MRRSLYCLLTLAACAEVPGALCFSGEPCAGGGGGVDAGGGTGGGGAAGTGGGGTAGTGGGTAGTGGADPAVPNVFADAGIPDHWADVTLPTQELSPPGYTRADVPIDGGIKVAAPYCNEAFMGAVALLDGRVLAIPACARRFAVIDPRPSPPTAVWVGPALPSDVTYGGAVLGCDGRVYALPYGGTSVMRVTAEAGGGFSFTGLPLPGGVIGLFSGGVVGRPCDRGFRIVTVGEGALIAIDPTETSLSMHTRPFPADAGVLFLGVARLGDHTVVSAPALSGGANGVMFVLDTESLVLSVGAVAGFGGFGIGTTRAGTGFLSSADGFTRTVSLDADAGTLRNTLLPAAGIARMRWPTNSLTGWMLTSGASLAAYAEDNVGTSDAVLLNPAVSDGGVGVTCGGLVVTTTGAVVSVPGSPTENLQGITVYTRAVPFNPPQPAALSPWFNKL